MLSLYKKEISSFFSSITGYLVIIVFLSLNSLFLFILPNSFNILDLGYASLESFFFISPWIFIFLVSAVTMRTFAEERKMGTLEIILTKPISDLKVVLAKYFASLTLVLLAILPTLVYYFSIVALGEPKGNIDTGATIGSYFGLIFLAGIYVSIGVFSSSITDNQIVSFIISVILSIILFAGFEQLSIMMSKPSLWLVSLGINEHYKSISRGIIDIADIIYFLGVISIFIVFTRMVLQSRKW